MIYDWESEDLSLSLETFEILQEFQTQKPNSTALDMSCFQENWQLSQFWYSLETCAILRDEVLDQTMGNASIACVSCPSAFFALSVGF